MKSAKSHQCFYSFALLVMAVVGATNAQTVTTVAGNSTWGQIYDVTLDSAGNIYAPDAYNHVVYKVDKLGATTILAGTSGKAGYAGDGALATSALLNGPTGVAIGADGSFYISDTNNQRIRKIASNGIITTFAGTGTSGFSGDGGQASAAKLYQPGHSAFDAAGNLIFVDFFNHRIRKITPAGVITTIAGGGSGGDGGLATAANIGPGYFALAPDGTVYFNDDFGAGFSNKPQVRKVSPTGTLSLVAGSGTRTYSGDGGQATSAGFSSVRGVALDSNGNLFVADANRIRVIAPSGIITTYAGTGTAGAADGTATKATFNVPGGITPDSDNNLYVADFNNRAIRKISPPALPAIRTTNPVLTSFLGNAGFSSNTYVEVYGSNLSTSTRQWAGSDFSGSSAPTSLDGVSVTVNGKPAFVYYISPGQVNINTPDDTATGPVAIQVKGPLGLSNVVMANRTAISPTLQSVPQFNIGGKQYVVALTPDFKTFIGRVGMLQGVAFQPAKPGDVISIYALGCGPTSPPTQAGVIAAQGSPLASPFTINIGSVAAPVSFGGMVGGSIGLYQFNVTIPFVPSGDQPIELIVNGVSNAQNLYIVIG